MVWTVFIYCRRQRAACCTFNQRPRQRSACSFLEQGGRDCRRAQAGQHNEAVSVPRTSWRGALHRNQRHFWYFWCQKYIQWRTLYATACRRTVSLLFFQRNNNSVLYPVFRFALFQLWLKACGFHYGHRFCDAVCKDADILYADSRFVFLFGWQ